MRKLAGSKPRRGLTRGSGQVLIQRSVYLTNVCHANFLPRISQFLFKETSCAQWLVKLAVVLQIVAKLILCCKSTASILWGNENENTLIIAVLLGKTTSSSHYIFFPQARTFAISKQAGVIVSDIWHVNASLLPCSVPSCCHKVSPYIPKTTNTHL